MIQYLQSLQAKTIFKTSENESERAIYWFKLNNMIVNPEKIQPVIIQESGSSEIC